MKTRVLFLACASVVAFVSPASAGFLDALLPQNDLETFTVTDFSKEGRTRRQPTPDKPVYYVAISAGYADLGGIVAGIRPIPREQMNSTVLKALAKQGYLPVPPGQFPELILVWKWGTLNTVYVPMSSNAGLGNTFTIQLNEMAIRRFLGGSKLGVVDESIGFPEYALSPGLRYVGGNAGALLGAARDDLYVAAISAYDWKLNEKGKPVMLWNTRISAPSRGFSMPDALPAMVAIATPFIGRETEKPMWIKASDHFKPDIKIGDPTVIAYLEKSMSVVENVGRNK